ncbi:MAG: putative Na+/H+ antiporter [bacterium]|nr:putative Na+/H+ antiporter [bacterium]
MNDKSLSLIIDSGERRRSNSPFTTARWALLSGLLATVFLVVLASSSMAAAITPVETGGTFPPPLASYQDSQMTELGRVLWHRVQQEPLNLWATLLFFGAVLHAFFTHQFLRWAHALEARHEKRPGAPTGGGDGPGHRCASARVLHFFGEVEVVFGIWCVPLFILLAIRAGWNSTVNYFSHDVSYVEPVFVVVIMAIASTRPILQLAERSLRSLARLGGGGPVAWWLAILTVGPILGSLITEPAAMTISALLLAKQFYALKPSPRLAYATLGLLFVNVSIGGVFTHFAAPPVLMVAKPWGWTTPFMLGRFGWVALGGIIVSNAIYYLALRKEFRRLGPMAVAAEAGPPQPPVPAWVTGVHLAFMFWTVLSAHYPALLIGGFMFFLAFYEVTQEYQTEIQLRPALLVGFFLAGLVIHGGLQKWWIGPILNRLAEVPLMLGAAVLTAFNDNAAITYLATLVPDLADSMKYAIVAGALAGGGLTVIANAPNPAGQAILARFFPAGIAPLGLLLGALPATIVTLLCFLFAR